MDVVHPLADAIDWHAEQPNSELWIAPGDGHSVLEDRTDQLVDELVRFYAQHVSADERGWSSSG